MRCGRSARRRLLYEFTLLVSWTDEESAKYLEPYQMMEGKSAENLLGTQQIQSNNFLSKSIDTMTEVQSIKKSDGQILLHAFGSFEAIVNVTNDQLSVCPGLGKLKAQRLFRAKPKKTPTSSSSTQKEKRPDDPEEDFLDSSNIDEEISMKIFFRKSSFDTDEENLCSHSCIDGSSRFESTVIRWRKSLQMTEKIWFMTINGRSRFPALLLFVNGRLMSSFLASFSKQIEWKLNE